MIIDLLVLTKNRYEFTCVMLEQLRSNTAWHLIRSVTFYDDESVDGTDRLVRDFAHKIPVGMIGMNTGVAFGSPVAIMNDFLAQPLLENGDVMLKLDSDTVVPPYWLEDCVDVMKRYPGVDLLGIEPFHETAPGPLNARGIEPARWIGGIGLMRRRCFMGRPLPTPNGRFGFTEWQERNEAVTKAWINPALQVFLLDRLPIEPYASLSAEYERKGWQRHWPPYDKDSDLWSWWKP